MIWSNFCLILGAILIVVGLIFFLGAAVGLIRFPDFYTRMHAAGKGDTLSSFLVVLGFALIHLHSLEFEHLAMASEYGKILVAIKLLAICFFIMLTSPVATHSLMDAGYEDGCEPLLKDDHSNALEDDGAVQPIGESSVKHLER